MKALIVDDEPLARRELRQLLAAHSQFTEIAEAADVQEALQLTRRLAPFVVFLDVQLRGESGFDYVDLLPAPAPRIVFVTAYDHYALPAFDCAAVDYLLKPVDPARLAATADRLTATTKRFGLAALKIGGEIRLSPWTDILRISSQGNYTRVYLRSGQTHLMLRTIKEWQAMIPDTDYLQVHRTSLVRHDSISEIRQSDRGDRTLVMSDASVVPIGRLFWPALKRALSTL